MNIQRVAVIMTVHNRKDKTIRCLDCLYACQVPDGFSFTVYLTDDGCTDGTPMAVAEKYPEVRILKGDGNLFWARGMRLAWTEAAKHDYDYYLWLNDDTFVYQDALRQVLKVAEDTDSKAVLVGATKSETSGICTYGIYNNHNLNNPNGSLQEGYGMNGNFVLVPRYVYQILGNFDLHYHHAGGDTYYGLLAKMKGVKVYLLPEYIGTCELHPVASTWCNPQKPFKERWSSLNKPAGMPLSILFYHQRKFYGIIPAISRVLTTIFRCCFPRLWRNG